MKRSTKILSLIFIILIIALIRIIFLQNKTIKKYSIKYRNYEMGAGTTTYKDFSNLKTLETEYSYSSITYGPDTEFVLLNNKETQKKFIYNETNLSSSLITAYQGKRKGFSIELSEENVEPKVLIKNCATDSKGNPLDAVIGLSNYKSYAINKEEEEEKTRIKLSTANGINQETDPESPIAVSDTTTAVERGTTQKSIQNKIGSPIVFSLYTYGAEVEFSITYYKHPDQYPESRGNYIYDLNKMTKAGITKVNGYYYDIDVNSSRTENRNLDQISIFTVSGSEKSKRLYEGINPLLSKNEKAVIYYNKSQNRHAIYYNSEDDRKNKENSREPRLAEDNGGIRIDQYTTTNKNGKTEVVPKKYNINTAWYGTSAFMTNYNLENSTMNFYYGGNDCGIAYAFMSPVSYDTPDPTKSVSSNKVTKGDKFYYEINQYIPNTYYSNELNFDKVYGGNYVSNSTIGKLEFTDTINSNLQIYNDEIKVYNESQDITNRFNITVSNSNKVIASLKENYYNTTDSYNCNFKLQIPVTLKSSGVKTKLIKNIAHTNVIMGKNNYSTNTNEVSTDIYYILQGNVWLEKYNNGNATDVDGRRNSGETNFRGIEVRLYRKVNNDFVYETSKRTDNNGYYTFGELPGDEIYKIMFIYNGQIYQSTYYKFDLSGGYSNAKESENDRNTINNKFATISSSPNNYDKNKRAYGIQQIIRDVDSGAVYYYNGTPLTYGNIVVDFIDLDSNIQSYNNNFYNTLINKMKNEYRLSTNTINSIISFMKDCMISSITEQEISINNVLGKNKNNKVDFGLYKRPTCDLSITDDIYTVTYMINGKTSSQTFNQKDKLQNVSDRANNSLYNGKASYALRIKGADYLYNASDYGLNNNRNLQMYVTYKISIHNYGQSYATVNSIHNWYDEDTYEYVGALCSSASFNGYIADDGNPYKVELQIENTNEKMKNGNYNYRKLNIVGKNGSIKAFHNDGTEDNLLAPGEETDIFITYKVKNNSLSNGKQKLIIEEGKTRADTDDEIGKKNIAEIAQYQTLYKANGNLVIPSQLNEKNERINKTFTSNIYEGTIDVNSNPGSLRAEDIDSNGNLKYNENRIENDTDKAPNLKIKISDASKISGKVFEDERTEHLSNSAVIGNGQYDNGEKLVNGVTIQLVELVRKVDENGFSTGKYINEKIWGSYTYDDNCNITSGSDLNRNDVSYYSGIGTKRVILAGDGITKIDTTTQLGPGEYMFDSVPSGDFYVRFIYGDTARTVLNNKSYEENSVNELLGESGIDGLIGLNAKSYNGQDFKSTVYQSNTNKVQSEYDGIVNNYNDDFYNNKNYINNESDFEKYINNYSDYISNIKDKLYFYDLSNINQTDSDAKDVYYYRERANKYASDLKNNNAMVLSSFENKILSSESDDTKRAKQIDMLRELITNTSMVAQTGVIDTTLNNGDKTTSVNLGLVERAKSQVMLNEGVTNVKVTLANNQVIFDTNKSVSNLYFGQHEEHQYSHVSNLLNRVTTINGNTKEKPELIQMYIDEELLSGASIVTTYTMTLKNVSETDYCDKTFYYTGVEKDENSNISTIKVEEIINYVPNSIKFREENALNRSNGWEVANSEELISDNKVDSYYKKQIETYNALIVTNKANEKELKPITSVSNEDEAKFKISLQLETLEGSSLINTENLVYNNLSEITELKSKNGRRMAYSIPGNQEMADQSLGKNAGSRVYTNVDVITPVEVDADSAQKVNVMPPTGKRTNNRLLIISIVMAIGIISAGTVLIKKLVLKNNY